jgi:hypothetical protein
MKRNISYLKYVIKHKWFVLYAGVKIGVPLWRLLIHDWSKFTPTEWGPYARMFFDKNGDRTNVRGKGGYDPNAQRLEFNYAWLSHQKNKHHWQAWISIGDGGSLKPLPIPEVFVKEMVADWCGAGRAVTGKWDIAEWYEINKEKMIVHPKTKDLIDCFVRKLDF